MSRLRLGVMFLCLIALAATTALAANIDGTWVMNAESLKGSVEFHFKLKAEGDKLTGAVQRRVRGRAERERPLSDGKISGNRFSFSITQSTKEGDRKLDYSGKIVGDELQGEMQMRGVPGRGRTFTAKRM